MSAGYDGHARLTSYSQGGTSLTHAYNGLDDRVSTTTGGVTRRYLYDAGGRVLGDYGASATDVNAEYVWLVPEVANDNATFGGDDGTGGYTLTTRRITSGDELKQRKGEGGLARDLRGIEPGYHRAAATATLD